MDNVLQPWERQPKETARAYAAFKVYLDLGKDRSADRAWSKVTGRNGGRSGHWGEWSVKWRWVERATAYDLHMARLEQEKREQALANEVDKWADRQRELREREFALSQQLLDKVEAMLKFPLQTVTRSGPKGENVTIVPADWAVRDVARLLETASKVSRLSAEMETENHKVQVGVQKELEAALDQLQQKLSPEVFGQVLEVLAYLPAGGSPPGGPES